MADDVKMNYNLTLNLNIHYNDEEYTLATQTEEGHFEYKLPVSRIELYQIIKALNDKLEKIVRKRPYSDNLTISRETLEKDLQEIAEFNLFDRIFVGPDPQTDTTWRHQLDFFQEVKLDLKLLSNYRMYELTQH